MIPSRSTIISARVVIRWKSAFAAHRCNLLLRPPHEREPGEITSVRCQEDDLETLDCAAFLLTSPELHALIEDLESLSLPTSYRLTPADEQTSLRHDDSPSVDLHA